MPPKIKNYEKVDLDCPYRGCDSADRTVAYQQDDGLRYRSRNGRGICGVCPFMGVDQVWSEVVEMTEEKRAQRPSLTTYPYLIIGGGRFYMQRLYSRSRRI